LQAVVELVADDAGKARDFANSCHMGSDE
jgi:hypothetical protein